MTRDLVARTVGILPKFPVKNTLLHNSVAKEVKNPTASTEEPYKMLTTKAPSLPASLNWLAPAVLLIAFAVVVVVQAEDDAGSGSSGGLLDAFGECAQDGIVGIFITCPAQFAAGAIFILLCVLAANTGD